MSCVEELKKILHDECMVVSQEEDFYSGIIKIRTNSVNKNWKSELLEWSNKFYERDRVDCSYRLMELHWRHVILKS